MALAQLLGFAMGVIFFAFVFAVYLKFLVRIIARFDATYTNCFWASVPQIVLWVIWSASGREIGRLVDAQGVAIGWVFIAVPIIVEAAAYAVIIQGVDGQKLSFLKALIISLVRLGSMMAVIVGLWALMA